MSVLDGGFEAGGVWTESGLAARVDVSPDAHGGDYVERLRSRSLLGLESSTVHQLAITATSGNDYRFTYWMQRRSNPVTDGHTLKVYTDDGGGGGWTERETLSIAFESWEQKTLDVTAAGSEIGIRFVATATNPLALGVVDHWLDDVSVQDITVAVKLSERAVDAVVSLLQSNLATELTAIETDRGDGLTLTAPANANYYKYPKPVLDGATTHLEVFEAEVITFDVPSPYVDADAQRAVYDLDLTVRLTHIRRDGLSMDDVVKRARRYAAGLFNVFSKNPEFDQSDAALQIVGASSVGMHWTFEGEDADKVGKIQVTTGLQVRCEETQS